MGQLEPGRAGPRYRVTGTTGSYVNGTLMDGQEDLLLAGHTPATLGEKWGVEPPERWGRLHRGDAGEPAPTRARALGHTFYPAFARAVRGLGPVPVDPRDAVATATVLDAAAAVPPRARSSRWSREPPLEGNPVQVPPGPASPNSRLRAAGVDA